MTGVIPPLPEGTIPLNHQVAGHVYGTGTTKFGFLKKEKGAVLKPIHSDDPDQLARRKSELFFYQKIFSPMCSDPVLLSLRPFLPKYLGTWSTPEHPNVTYIKLEDISDQFNHPCIMDVKMGCITYTPDATVEKKTREIEKYPPAVETGFQLLGIRVYQPENENYKIYNRKYLRSLSKEELFSIGLNTFLRVESHWNYDIINGLLEIMRNLKQWFTSQRQYQFFAASLLFVYEGDTNLVKDETGLQPATSSNNNSRHSRHVDLRMIDLPKVYPTEQNDENFLAGLNNLIAYFEKLLERTE